MSVNLNKFSISAGLDFISKQAMGVTERLGELTFSIFDGTTTYLGRLLPDLRPTSVGDVVLQLKKTGSGWFETPKGFLLVEISRNNKGLYELKATDEFFHSVIICEGKRSHSGALWEVEVSNYLQKIVKNSTSVSYGETASRWRGDKFTKLKEYFAAEGLLRDTGSGVMLKLPGEKPLTFADPYASMKAEIVLKHFYQMRKTPMEEEQSKHWDTFNRLLTGYLYFSGYALAPWVNDHVMLPHQRAEWDANRADQMVADGYLDGNELKEIAMSASLRQHVVEIADAQADQGNTRLFAQLEQITFRPNGYTQAYEYDGTSYEESHVFSTDREVHSRTVCPDGGVCEEYITEQSQEELVLTQKTHGDVKIDVQKATFKKEGDRWKLVNEKKYAEGRVLQLPDRSFAPTIIAQAQQVMANTATVYMAAMIAKQNPKIALMSSLFNIISKAEAFATPKLELVVRRANGMRTGLAGSLTRRTSPITLLSPLPNFSVEPGAQLSYNINLASYCELSNPNQNLELSIQQANGLPAPSWISMKMGALTLQSSLYLGANSAASVYVSGNYAYVTLGSGGMNIVDITNPASPAVVGVFAATNAVSVIVKGNYAYLLNGKQLQVINIATPSSPTLVTTFTVSSGPSPVIQMAAEGNYLYFCAYYIQGVGTFNLEVISISNPTNPTQVGTLTLNSENQGFFVSGNYAFIGTTSGNFYIVNISTPTTPILITTIIIPTVGSTVSISVKGNYLFIGTGPQLSIYDITTISSPVLVKTVYVGPDGISSLTLEGDYVYVSYDSNVIIIDITNVQNAHIVASFSTLASTYTSSLSNNNVIVANGASGLTIFNAGSRVLSGTPSVSNRGLLLLNVTAQDDLTDTLVDPIAIHVGDINVAVPTPNQQVYVGNSTMFTLNPGTFQFPNATFTYSAELVGGLPLPSCINFNPTTLTFQFTPHSGDQNTYRIQVNGNDGFGGTISTTFDLVVPDRIPVLAQPLGNQTAYTNVFFQYIVSSSSFTDADNDQLVYTANEVGSDALPGWLSFDPALRRFYGTPFGRNIYDIEMTANDKNGGITSGTFTITVPSSAPILINPVGTQLASIGTPFSFTFNSNTFSDFDTDPLTYSTNTLPTFLSFNNATRTFTGTPQTQDAGTYSITIDAENPFGATASATFTLTVLSSSNDIPPVLVRAIPDFSITSGIPFNTTFNAGTFDDAQGQTLTYTATQEGGDPLPLGLYFNANTLTLSGVVAKPQALRITIKATDPYGAFAIDTFTLTVLDGTKYPPIVLNPLPDQIASVGAPFSMQVPASTFQDVNGDDLTITVTQSGGLPIPEWLKWDAEKLSFSGSPGPFDTNTYAARQVTIDVWAADSVGSVKTSFIITVQGESFWASFIKNGSIFASVAGTAIGVWKERALIWNYLRKKEYQTETERAYVGQSYCHRLKLKLKDIEEICVLSAGKRLPHIKPLPDGLVYDDDQITGTPTAKSQGRYTIRIIDHDRYINEEFELIIKNENDPDPEIEKKPSYIKLAKMQLSDLPSRFSKKEGDEKKGQGYFGKISKNFQMKVLNKNDQETNV